MLLRKSIAARAHTPQDGGTARSHRATRLGERGEGQTTTSLPPPPPPESLTGVWPPGTTWIQTREGWVPNWPDDVPSEVWQPTPLTQPPPLGHDNSAAPTRGEQGTQSTEGAQRRPQRSSPQPAARNQHTPTERRSPQPAAAEEPGQPGGRARTNRPRATAKAGSSHGSPKRGRRPGQPGPTETAGDPDTDPWREDAEARDPGSSSSNQPAVDSSQQEAATLPRPGCEQAGAGAESTQPATGLGGGDPARASPTG